MSQRLKRAAPAPRRGVLIAGRFDLGINAEYRGLSGRWDDVYQMEIVFRKVIKRNRFELSGESQVLNRYPLPTDLLFTTEEIAWMASRVFEEDYGHPFEDYESIFWTLE